MISPTIQVSEQIGLGTKILTLNGDPAIHSCTDAEISSKTVVVKDNALLFLIEGNLQITHGTDNYLIAPNQMVLLKKNIIVKYHVNTQQRTDNTEIIFFYFKEDLLKDFVKQATLTVSPPQHSRPVTTDIIDYRLLRFPDSLHLYFDNAVINENITRIKLLELLFNLASKTGPLLEQLMDLRPHFRADITATVEDHLLDSISLPQLAEFAGRSLSSFKRDFVAIYNMPPSKWLRQRKLEKASELLRTTTMTITDVCYTLGFENLAHFSRLFKAHFSYSPSRFRVATSQPS